MTLGALLDPRADKYYILQTNIAVTFLSVTLDPVVQSQVDSNSS